MGLFSRRRNEEPAAVEPDEAPATSGPWDFDDQPELGDRVDLGALRIPRRPGLQFGVELDRGTRRPVSLTLTQGGSAVQLQVVAAPRSGSLWDEVRPELLQSVRDRGGQCDDVPGVFGRELIARMAVTTPAGTVTRAVRYVGVDGPRWMLRAAFSGRAALEREAAKALEDVLRDVVVVRGPHARPPREVLPLTLPGAAAPTEAVPSDDPLGILRRGPEITETR